MELYGKVILVVMPSMDVFQGHLYIEGSGPRSNSCKYQKGTTSLSYQMIESM